jgi:two-component system, LytTR family, response regulator
VLQTIYSPQMPLVIFVTAFDKYAIKAFEFHALDYLLKPFTLERLQSAIKRVREQMKNEKNDFDERIFSLLSNLKDAKSYLDRIMLRSSGKIYFLKTEEIDWIEACFRCKLQRVPYIIRYSLTQPSASFVYD